MPRFFIHIRNGHGDQPDRTGNEFVDGRMAVAEAAKMAGELMRDDVHDALGDYAVRVTVTSSDEQVVGIIEMTLALSGHNPG